MTKWSNSLCTILGTMLHSSFPMFLWWGEDRLQFYNDAFRHFLSNQGKHPTALGQRGEACWANQWPSIAHHITQAFVEGQANQSDAELISTVRGSAISKVPWAAEYSPVWNEAGLVAGVLFICQEILRQGESYQAYLKQAQLASESSQVGHWTVDMRTRLVDWDDGCKKLYGVVNGQEFTYQQILPLIHPDDVIRISRIIQWIVTARSGEQVELSYRVIGGHDGQLRWLQSTGKAFFNEVGELSQFKGTTQQVTWEQGTQSQLEQIEHRFQRLLDDTPVAISVMRGPEFITELINQQMCLIIGRTQEQMLGKPAFEVLVEAAGQGFEELLLGVLQTGVPFVGNELPTTLLRDGLLQRGYINASFVPLREVDGLITGITVVLVEVTEQVIARHRVESSAAYLERIFHHAPTAICIFRGPTFVVELTNPIMCALWDRTEEQLLGIPIFEALPEAQGQGFEELLTEVLRTGQPFVGTELPVTLKRHGQLETVYFEFTYEPFPEIDGRVERIIVTAVDATKRTQIRQQTEQLLIQERKLNELKSNFVTMASHEFRTPMATILSSATLIDEYSGVDDGDNRKRHVQRIQSAIQRLTRILDDFLLITQLEQKKWANKAQLLVLVDFCEELIEEMQSFLKPGQRIIYQYLEGPETITIDGYMIKNILINLLSNASKYSSEEKDILLTIAVQSNQLVLSVRDWGIGIPEPDQANLFTNFFRARNVSHVSGTGLGLYIVKRSVDLLGGTITFHSELGLGTTFTVQVPLPSLPA
ncbi:PAS domain-containing protein [Spirosoma arboris]|nr:PAS domain-containing protein [Spirosoma arboris]